MMLTQGELQTSMHSKQRNLEQHLAENRKLTTELTTEKNKVSHSSSLIKQLQRKLLLVTRERDSYRSLLDSYENEVTINFDLEKKAQIQRLEAIVQGYKEQSRELEAELQTVTDKLVETQAQCCQLQQQLNTAISSDQQAPSLEDKELIIQLRERMSELESNLIITQREKDILEARIEQRHLQGDYDPSKTKVVHFTLNPCALAQKARCEELQKLKEENERLTKRNQILEEHGGNVEDLTVQVQEKLLHPSPSKEVEEMRAQLQREEMRNKRLMEVFKKTSQEFREVCYQLTGYKIDIPCANQYRLTSMYADCPRDHFLFQQNSQGEIQMLQTDFSLTVQDAIELYLQKHNSIPLFLSHITMELFGRQTMNLG
uniref:Spindle assembly checkpoint component MAD1 n=1 Tax=Arion vulgaris TaxID=1028688 RepID=A0A0B7A767_9EUPU